MGITVIENWGGPSPALAAGLTGILPLRLIKGKKAPCCPPTWSGIAKWITILIGQVFLARVSFCVLPSRRTLTSKHFALVDVLAGHSVSREPGVARTCKGSRCIEALASDGITVVDLKTTLIDVYARHALIARRPPRVTGTRE
eukprot:2673602-Rhodomonas_salina.1